jgi:hypothetical protein
MLTRRTNRGGEVSMTIHQCPKCELKFAIKTVLDWHLRNDHPQFHHDYPVRGVHHWDAEAETAQTGKQPAQ